MVPTGESSTLDFCSPKRQRLTAQQNVIGLMTVDLKQIPDANRIGPSSAGLTHKGGSGQKEAGSRARRVPGGEGALPAASPLIAKPSPSALIWGKETSKGKFICPGTALGKPRANRAYRLPTERGRTRHMPREGDGPEGSTLLRAEAMQGSNTSTPPHFL